jgi:hypothetical protein
MFSPIDATRNADYRLQDFLATQNPKIAILSYLHSSKTTTRNKRWSTPSKIEKWQDFNTETLKECSNGIFSEMLKYPMNPYTTQHLNRTTSLIAEETLDLFFASWTIPVVKEALLTAQTKCKHFQQPYITWTKGKEASRTDGGFNPDWAGIRPSELDKTKPKNILPGETKRSAVWQSSKIDPAKMNTLSHVPKWLWPIKQAFTYCLELNARYGYIITDKEVFVFRVHADHKAQTTGIGDPNDAGWLEYATIEYDHNVGNGDSSDMTVNMALWWIHLLAGNGKIYLDYPPLKDESLYPSAVSSTSPQIQLDDPCPFVDSDQVSAAGSSRTEINTLVESSSYLVSPGLSGSRYSFRSLGSLATSFDSNYLVEGSQPSRELRHRRSREEDRIEQRVKRNRKRRKQSSF